MSDTNVPLVEVVSAALPSIGQVGQWLCYFGPFEDSQKAQKFMWQARARRWDTMHTSVDQGTSVIPALHPANDAFFAPDIKSVIRQLGDRLNQTSRQIIATTAVAVAQLWPQVLLSGKVDGAQIVEAVRAEYPPVLIAEPDSTTYQRWFGSLSLPHRHISPTACDFLQEVTHSEVVVLPAGCASATNAIRAQGYDGFIVGYCTDDEPEPAPFDCVTSYPGIPDVVRGYLDLSAATAHQLI